MHPQPPHAQRTGSPHSSNHTPKLPSAGVGSGAKPAPRHASLHLTHVLFFPFLHIFDILTTLTLFLLWSGPRRLFSYVFPTPPKQISENRRRLIMSGPSFNRDDKNRASGSSRTPKEIDIDSYQKFHKFGYDLMCKALTMDEGSSVDEDKKTAVALYVQAILELERGVAAIDSIPDALKVSEADRFERVQVIKNKIMRNLEMAKERVTILGDELEANMLAPAKKPAEQPKRPITKARNSNVKGLTLMPGQKFNNAAKIAPVSPTPQRTSNVIPKSTGAKTSRSPSGGRGGANARRPLPTSTTTARAPRPTSREDPASPGPPVTPRSQRKHLGALKNVDSAMAQLILDQVIDNSPGITWDAVAGQEGAKQALQENVVWPALRPEVFTGLRAPARGILLFGPPGNGKTLLAKAVATESKQTFFNISASILTSKWVGDSEKLVRALFGCARELQPSIIFIDEIDSILSARKDSEHDAVRRLKTEFLVQFDGVGTTSEDRILVMGATNLPQELDLAALRRFPKRIMIPLPDEEARMGMIKKLVGDHPAALREEDFEEIADMTEGYSGSDLAALAKDAAMGPIREVDPARVPNLKPKEIRPITLDDFIDATRRIRPSVPPSSIDDMKAWSLKYADCS
ncbi:spastin-like [Paramacrobiotus metropolitanus]|uniref:spastin-like n=1 Tax=Paramacrobiotus metropolitanus TaxID=2943436 RepID=UPI002445CF32|nr:spastin-like [Paramacrobiotus metropolitanus]